MGLVGKGYLITSAIAIGGMSENEWPSLFSSYFFTFNSSPFVVMELSISDCSKWTQQSSHLNA